MRIFLLMVWLVLIAPVVLAADESKIETTVEIVAHNDNLSSSAHDNVRLYTETVLASSPRALGNWQLQLKQSIKQALQALGYYQPTIAIDTSYDQAGYHATLTIDQGTATTISQLDIRLIGAAQDDNEFAILIANSPLQLGGHFNHGNYQSFKNSINDLAITRGYFQGQWQTNQVKVDPSLNQASIELIFNSGPRFKFGEIVFTQPSEAQQLILAMSTFRSEQFYHSDLLAQYNLALSKSKYFSAIEVFPDFAKRSDDMVPIAVNIVEKPGNSIEVGAGVSSNSGVRGRLKWIKPWLNSYGHSLSAELKLSNIEQSFSATYKIPIEDPIDNYGTISLGWQHLDNNDISTSIYSLLLQRHQLLDNNWKRSLFIRFEREDSTQGLTRWQTTNIIPGVSYSRTRLKGGLAPYWGDRQSATLELGHQGWGSDANLAKLTAHSKWLRSINIDHQFLASADLGAIWVDSIDQVPVSMRIFGGGDDNLRAYEFESISPINQDGILTGGLYQANLSLEYNYQFIENWRIAAFVDTGTTTNDFSESLKTDVGFGIRWQTPVGPIKLDFAFGLTKDPVHEDFDRPFRISFSIGPSL